jgi:hypothetical protein
MGVEKRRVGGREGRGEGKKGKRFIMGERARAWQDKMRAKKEELESVHT